MEIQEDNLSEVLASNYLVASLHIRTWTARKTDREASRELTQQKGADLGAATVITSLLAGNDKELKACLSAYNQARNFFLAATLPWQATESGRGDRLIGVNEAMAFMTSFAHVKAEADRAREVFLNVYDQCVQAARSTHGALYDPGMYPSKDEVKLLFGVSLDIRPMPAVVDFDRVQIPAAMARGLKARYESRATKQVELALQTLQERLVSELDRMQTQFAKVAKGEKSVKLYKTLLSNMDQLCGLAKTMAPVSPGLSSLADRIRAALLQNKLDDYRENMPLARRAAESAEAFRKELTGTIQQETTNNGAADGSTQELPVAESADTRSADGSDLPAADQAAVEPSDAGTFDFDPDSAFDLVT